MGWWLPKQVTRFQWPVSYTSSRNSFRTFCFALFDFSWLEHSAIGGVQWQAIADHKNTWLNHQLKQPPAQAGPYITHWELTVSASSVVLFWPAQISLKGLCSSRKHAEFGLCILASRATGSWWGEGKGGGRMEKYPAVPLKSNFLLTLADSESPTACLPSPAAHPPIRPAALLS